MEAHRPRATPCEGCDNVTASTRALPPHRWACIRFPRIEGLDPVAPTLGAALSPYNLCRNINVGHCPLWAPRRDGQLEIAGVK